MPLGVKALNAVPIKSKKGGLGEVNVAVNFAGITFTPGEFVYADEDGVITSAQKLL
jgi:regulator of ribonuclease activity A